MEQVYFLDDKFLIRVQNNQFMPREGEVVEFEGQTGFVTLILWDFSHDRVVISLKQVKGRTEMGAPTDALEDAGKGVTTPVATEAPTEAPKSTLPPSEEKTEEAAPAETTPPEEVKAAEAKE
jgi:hypothetical protein